MRFCWGIAVVWAGMGLAALGQSLPGTAGETLTGKRIVVAEAVRGKAVVVIAGFSKAAGDACGDWAKAIRADQSMQGVVVYQVASLESAPGFVRGMIKGAMRKGLSEAQQDHFVVLTQDEKLWREYFGVTAEKEPYVVLLDVSGAVKWHGHGLARDLEPLVRAALR